MLYNINNYIYDSDRLILIEKSMSIYEYEQICRSIASNCLYINDLTKLKCDCINQKSMREKVVKNAGIALNYNCGLRCNYCSQKSEENNFESLTIDEILVFIKDVIKKRKISSLITKDDLSLNVYFTGGGEPTYNWLFFSSTVEKIEELCKKHNVKLSFGITTNGILNTNQLQFISNHFEKVLISYDGNSKIQDKNRRTANNLPTSKIVENSIKSFIASGVTTTIRSTIWQDDFIELTNMADYIYNNFDGLYSWDINPVTPAGRAVEIMLKEQAIYSKADFVESYLNLINYIRVQKYKLLVTTPLLSSEPIGFNCGGIGSSVHGIWLLPDKRITTCVDSSEIVTEVGKIENDSVIYYDNFEDPLINMGIKKLEECRDCIAFRVCGSGCPIKHIREESNGTNMLSWECSMQSRFWEYILNNVVDSTSCFGWKAIKLDFPNIKNKSIYKLVYSNN